MNTEDKLKEAALRYHREPQPGKIAVVPTKPHRTQEDLSLAYSPGVAAPSRAVAEDPASVYEYTGKGNLVAVISNGTAVLGLGNIGPLAAKPVMEGKSMLFKTFAGIDAFDIEVAENDPEAFVRTVRAIAPTFGGINLEDIKAPECFEIEERLRRELDIPVMHDDQHGTAIITSAALLNGAKIAGKELPTLRVVVNGAGAAAIACARLFLKLGVRREHMVLCDSRGVVAAHREDLNPLKREFATTRRIASLAEALHGADVFLGVSKANVLTPEMLRSMAPNPIVMALANPDPEIAYDVATVTRPDLIFATGRSDYPNQVNNVLGFPYIFRGALDVRASEINDAMKLAAARAIAAMTREPVPESVLRDYNLEKLEFGRGYLIPKPTDPRLLTTVATAVARAAIESGVARRPISDWEAYTRELRERTK
ncbi:malic enzyme-like NAD(P)-binding protein [uncultured Alistipes sp.]|uniref:malic enzyme-like NAD(P)-binding protein n=1 Tax=uncultured Alistipes sp. TaxID=538949 RepID=UPI002605669C|nr:malic enzyme-like NAD(P)-binding protein [uncultured Alistipes sp.]